MVASKDIKDELNQSASLGDEPVDHRLLPTSYSRDEMVQLYRSVFNVAVNGGKPAASAAVSALTCIAKLMGYFKDDEQDLKDKKMYLVNFARPRGAHP